MLERPAACEGQRQFSVSTYGREQAKNRYEQQHDAHGTSRGRKIMEQPQEIGRMKDYSLGMNSFAEFAKRLCMHLPNEPS